jgi:hypothetical protein
VATKEDAGMATMTIWDVKHVNGRALGEVSAATKEGEEGARRNFEHRETFPHQPSTLIFTARETLDICPYCGAKHAEAQIACPQDAACAALAKHQAERPAGAEYINEIPEGEDADEMTDHSLGGSY